jgi:hypothetical protein
VLALVAVAACAGGSKTPTVSLRSPANAVILPPDVVSRLSTKCSPGIPRVRLDLVQGDVHLRHAFQCAVVKHEAEGEAALLDLVARRHGAAEGADLAMELLRELRVTGYGRSNLIWAIGTGLGCKQISDVALQRQRITDSARWKGPLHQTPTQWTEIEAARYAGGCPDRLDAFFDSVAHAGYPTAAARARAEVTRLLATPPTASAS